MAFVSAASTFLVLKLCFFPSSFSLIVTSPISSTTAPSSNFLPLVLVLSTHSVISHSSIFSYSAASNFSTLVFFHPLGLHLHISNYLYIFLSLFHQPDTHELVGHILSELSFHNERNDARKHAMSTLMRLARESKVHLSTLDNGVFNSIVLLLLEILGDDDASVRTCALKVFQVTDGVAYSSKSSFVLCQQRSVATSHLLYDLSFDISA